MTEPSIEARAERLAQAREHWHCSAYGHGDTILPTPEGRNYCWLCGEVASVACSLDHRTPAEQRAAVLDALAMVLTWFTDHQDLPYARMRTKILYYAIQRTEGPQ